MITHLFGEGNPRQDYLLKIISSYLGMPIHPFIKNKICDIVFESSDNRSNIQHKSKAIIEFDNLIENDTNFKPVISGYFLWKGLSVPIFNRTHSKVKGKAFLKDTEKQTLITLGSDKDGTLKATINFNILETIHYFICSLEEIETKESDDFGRFQHTSSILHKEKLMHTPLVTIYLDIILDLVKEIYMKLDKPLIRVWPWPFNKGFAIGLSHDTDEIQRFTIKKSAHSMLKKEIHTSIETLKGSFGPLEENDYWTFSKILQIEKDLGTVSTFFFSGLTNEIKSKRPRKQRKLYELAYTTDPPEIKELYQNIDSQGWEIGLHASFSTLNNTKRLDEEMKNISGIIDKQIVGNRQHFLMIKIPDYFKAMTAAEFKYDTSLGYSTHSGFRSGACHPYMFFNDIEKKQYDLMLIPLAIMEGTLSKEKQINPLDISKAAMEIISTIEKFNGGCSILWHNNRFLEKEFSGWAKAYQQIIKRSIELGGYVTTLRNIYDWTTNKDRVTITPKSDIIEIKSAKTLEGLTIEMCASKEQIKEFISKNPDMEIINSQNNSVRLIVKKITSKKGIVLSNI